MHLTGILFLSLSTIPSLIHAIPKPLQPSHKLSKRGYYAGFLSRTAPLRTYAGYAPVCRNADGTLCDRGPCYLDGTWKDYIFIDCSDVLLCTYYTYDGPACEGYPANNSAEICQQSDDEVIDTIAKETGYSREVAAEKFRILNDYLAKGLTYADVCPPEAERVTFPVNPTMPALEPVVAPVTEEQKEEPKKDTENTPSLPVVSPVPSQVSEEPKKEEPEVVLEPVVVQPIVEEPKKEEPKKEDPKEVDTVLVDPIVEQPQKEEPKNKKPKVKAPKKHGEFDNTTTIYHEVYDEVTSTRYFTVDATPAPTSTSTGSTTSSITVTPEPTEEPSEPEYEGPGYGNHQRKGGRRKNIQKPCYWNAGCEGLEEAR